MSRRYTVPFLPATIANLATAQADLWALTSTSSMPFVLEEIKLDPCATSVAEFQLSLNLFTGSFTAGSGGTTVTPAPRAKGDTAAVTTAKVLNTTKTLVGTGVKLNLDAGQWNLVNGWWWQPLDPDHRIYVPVSACLVVSLDTTPSSQIVSGTLIFREDY